MNAPAKGEVIPAAVASVAHRFEIKPTLGSCESAIQRAFDAYAMAGDALRTIRDRRLYKEAGFSSFDAYSRERWGWTRQHADQLVAAAQVFDVLYEAGRTDNGSCQFEPPRTEFAARELAPLRTKPKLLVQAWQETVERHGPDAQAKHVRATVQRIAPARPAPAAEPIPERTLNDTVTALRRLIERGHTPKLICEALNAIDPEGARHA